MPPIRTLSSLPKGTSLWISHTRISTYQFGYSSSTTSGECTIPTFPVGIFLLAALCSTPLGEPVHLLPLWHLLLLQVAVGVIFPIKRGSISCLHLELLVFSALYTLKWNQFMVNRSQSQKGKYFNPEIWRQKITRHSGRWRYRTH